MANPILKLQGPDLEFESKCIIVIKNKTQVVRFKSIFF